MFPCVDGRRGFTGLLPELSNRRRISTFSDATGKCRCSNRSPGQHFKTFPLGFCLSGSRQNIRPLAMARLNRLLLQRRTKPLVAAVLPPNPLLLLSLTPLDLPIAGRRLTSSTASYSGLPVDRGPAHPLSHGDKSRETLYGSIGVRAAASIQRWVKWPIIGVVCLPLRLVFVTVSGWLRIPLRIFERLHQLRRIAAKVGQLHVRTPGQYESTCDSDGVCRAIDAHLQTPKGEFCRAAHERSETRKNCYSETVADPARDTRIGCYASGL